MPVRDAGAWLGDSVGSILRQSLPGLELIVVDDHSRDGAIAQLDRSDARLQVMPNPGRGVSQAFNAGMARASGRYVARMDADDIALPDRLERQTGYLQDNPEVGICGACVEIFTDGELAGGNRRYRDWLNRCRTPEAIREALFIESPVPNPTALFRRAALQRLGGYAEPDWPEDYDLFLRADALGIAMGKPDEVLLRWRDHPGRLTRRDARYGLDRFQAAKAHFLASGRLPPGRPVVLWGAGPTGRQMHDLLHAEGVSVEGFLEVHPRRIGGRKRARPVWFFEDTARYRGAFVLVAVGAAGARARIRRFLLEQGCAEGRDFLFVA